MNSPPVAPSGEPPVLLVCSEEKQVSLTLSMDSLLEEESSLRLELSDARLGVFFSSLLVFRPFLVFSCSSSSLLSSLIWHLAAEVTRRPRFSEIQSSADTLLTWVLTHLCPVVSSSWVTGGQAGQAHLPPRCQSP